MKDKTYYELSYYTPNVNKCLKIGAALVALVFVLLIFIAPMVDLPDTVLREHQVTAHTSAGQLAGDFNVRSGSFHVRLPLYEKLITLHLTVDTTGIRSSAAVVVMRC